MSPLSVTPTSFVAFEMLFLLRVHKQKLFDLPCRPGPSACRGGTISDASKPIVAADLVFDLRGSLNFVYWRSFISAGAHGLGRQVHAQTVLVGGFAADLYVGNTMIDMFLKCGELGSTRKVFDEMTKRDVVMWTELIAAYAKGGDMDSARELFERLGVKDMVAWTAMVTGYAQNLMPKEALDCFERMRGEWVEIDEVTLLGVVSACAQLGVCRYGDWVRDIAEECGFGAAENVLVGSVFCPFVKQLN